MDQQQFEERMEEALAVPFPKKHWPKRFGWCLEQALHNSSPFSLGIKADAYARLVAFQNDPNDNGVISLADAAAALNAIEAQSPKNLSLDLEEAAEAFKDIATSALAWNEIVEPLKKKAFAEIAAQAKLQQNAPKGKQVKLTGGKKK